MCGSRLLTSWGNLKESVFRIILISSLIAPSASPAAAIKIKNRSPKSVSNLDDFVRTDALDDPMNRIGPDFQVPEALRKRPAFWFDIYTLYGSNDNVIHHSEYPWIIYK